MATANPTLLSIGTDAKTPKGQARGILTGILFLAPHTLAGRNLCTDSTPGCRQDCIYLCGGNIRFPSVQAGRIRKTRAYHADRPAFVERLSQDVARLERKAHRMRLRPAVRLNGTSDEPWEWIRGADKHSTMARHPGVTFYDYTKHPRRMLAFLDGRLPANYHLTFSRSESNEAECHQVLGAGGNVAVVFSTRKGQPLPRTWDGYRVIDGDLHDYRPSDARGVVVGLRAKGPARQRMAHGYNTFVVKV